MKTTRENGEDGEDDDLADMSSHREEPRDLSSGPKHSPKRYGSEMTNNRR